jgi:hypothetical protein
MAQRKTPLKSLLTCRKCKLELRLSGIETETAERDLCAFECVKCGNLEVNGVRID